MLRANLYPHQEDAVTYAMEHHYCIIADQMGLGKTLEAIAVADKTNLKTLIVCPAFLKRNWENEIGKFCPSLDFDIISYSSIAKNAELFEDAQLWIADECHYLKNKDAKRTKYFHKLLKHHRPKRFIGLSGTPIKNRVSEFYSLLKLCDYNPRNSSGKQIPYRLQDYWKFCHHFSHATRVRTPYGFTTKFEGHRNVDQLRELLVGKYIRRKAEEVLNLPDLNRINLYTPKQSRDKELKDAWESYTGKPSDHISMVKLACALSKVKFTASWVEDTLESEKHLIVFTDHVKVAENIASTISKRHKVGLITGNVGMEKRNDILDSFRSGSIRVLVATIGSCSVGVTLTNSRIIIFNDLPWVPSDIMQAEKRIHRIGQGEKCFIYRVVGSEIDGTILGTLTNKMETLEAVL